MKVSIRDWEVDLSWPRQEPERVFIRFGLWDTRDCRSINFSQSRTHYKEEGLSVYPARLVDGVIELTDEMEISPAVEGRLAFGVTGRVVGTGQDGEPVLRGVRPLPYALALDTYKRIPREDVLTWISRKIAQRDMKLSELIDSP